MLPKKQKRLAGFTGVIERDIAGESVSYKQGAHGVCVVCLCRKSEDRVAARGFL